MDSNMLSPVLFAASVPAHQVALERGDLERGLYYGLLLERSLAFLDSSFFVIPAFENHVRGAQRRNLGESWLEMGLRTGAIVPLVREDVTRFGEILDILLRDKYIGASESKRDLAELLARKVPQKTWRVWPSRDQYGFSDQLAKRISDLYVSPKGAPLANGLCDVVYDGATKFWSASREWRETWIPNAIKMRYDISGPGHGLRLLDVIEIAGRELLGDNAPKIENAADLLKATEKVHGISTQRVLRQLLILLDHEWLTNFCEGMNLCGVPIGLMDHRWHPIVSQLDPEADYAEARGDDSVTSGAGFEEIQIELPSLNVLRATPSRVIEDIWANGGAYFEALEKWRSDPSDAHTESLGEQLAAYSRMVMAKIGAETVGREQYSIKTLTTGGLFDALSRIAGGLIAYSTVGGSGPKGITIGVAGAVATGALLAPIRRHFVLERRRVRTRVRLSAAPAPYSAATQISQSRGILGRRMHVRLNPLKDRGDSRA